MLKPTRGSFIAILLASVNIFLCLDIVLRVRGRRSHPLHEFAYRDRDSPLYTPIPPKSLQLVSTTFSESTRFSLLRDLNYTQPAYKTLTNALYGSGFYYLGLDDFRYVSGGYHSLHCVMFIFDDLNKPGHRTNPSDHYEHCLFYLRQVFLCNADSTLEEGDFMKRDYTVDRVGEEHVCRDWTAMDAWLDEQFHLFLARHDVVLDED